jgi:hypothetical protein
LRTSFPSYRIPAIGGETRLYSRESQEAADQA